MFEYLIDALVDLWPILKAVLRLAPLWLPVMMVWAFWTMWVKWRRAMFIDSQEPILLEIRVPKEIDKSPLAMELAINGFYATGDEGTWKDKYWKGGVRAWFSLELVSIEGQVKFFIWTWKKNVKNVQNHIYAQYPTVEIVEVPDYAMAFLFDKDKADIYAAEFGLGKPDAYPIKTYIDYGLDRDPKEEYKIDPITPVIEYLGGLGKGEQAWIQIIIRAHKDEDKKEGGIFAGIKSFEDLFFLVSKIQGQLKPTDNWKDGVKKEIESIVEKRKIKGKVGDDGEEKGTVALTMFEKDIVNALERSVSKLGFDAGIRVMYLAEKDAWNPGHKGALNGVFMQYNSPSLNAFKKGDATTFDYWYQDPLGTKLPEMKQDMFEAYRARGFFHLPHKRKHFVLNAEELATIFHFPGGVAATPTLSKIESKKSGPPGNLPI
ncbi:MAG: hypothetical protein KBD16_01255 [Candidatus Pacebacteria bacterium]|nr:hypothetical protein [Candidatus Paceibacterota bacterium]